MEEPGAQQHNQRAAQHEERTQHDDAQDLLAQTQEHEQEAQRLLELTQEHEQEAAGVPDRTASPASDVESQKLSGRPIPRVW